MIIVHRLGKDSESIVINADQIEFIEEHPDTVISMINGKKILVKESMDEIIQKVLEFRKSIMTGG